MRTIISAYPDVGGAEFEARLGEQLHAGGARVVERCAHPRGQVFPALAGVLARHPEAQAFTFFEPAHSAASAPAVVLHRHGSTAGHWDAPLAQALSQAFGGWSLSVLSDRQREEYGVGVFYAGCAVEAAAWQGGQPTLRWAVAPDVRRLDENGTWQAFAAHYRSISDAHESDLRWSDDVNVSSWVVQGLAGSPQALRLDSVERAGGSLRRAMFIDVGEARLRDALSQSAPVPPSLRTLERAAPITQAPYTLLDGDFDDAWFTALAWVLNVQALCVDLGGAEGQFSWCEVGIDRNVRAGVDRGAAALANRWGALTVMLGEPASIVRWPGTPPSP